MKRGYLAIATTFLTAFIMCPAQFALSCEPMVILPPGKFEGTWEIVRKETVERVYKTNRLKPYRPNEEILHKRITLAYDDPIKVDGPDIFKNCHEATYKEVSAEHRFKGSAAEYDKAIKDKKIDLGRAELRLHCISNDTSDVEVIFSMAVSTGQANFALDNAIYTIRFIEP